MLNAYCLIALKVGNNRHLIQELDKSYIEGYQAMKHDIKDYTSFIDCISKFKLELNANNRNLASEEDLKHLDELDMIAELGDHESWVNGFTNNYTK